MQTLYLLSSAVPDVTSGDLLRFQDGLTQSAGPFARAYGLQTTPWKVAIGGQSPPNPSPNLVVCTIVADLLDPSTNQPVPGALAWHYIDDAGIRHIDAGWNAFVAAGGGKFVGTADAPALSLLAGLDHELKEDAADPACNDWRLRVDGTTLVAGEVCDPVESDGYSILIGGQRGQGKIGGMLSNFVLPAWFDPEAPAGTRLDYLGRAGAPLEVSQGGYLMTMSTDGSESEEDGDATKKVPLPLGAPLEKARSHDVTRRVLHGRVTRFRHRAVAIEHGAAIAAHRMHWIETLAAGEGDLLPSARIASRLGTITGRGALVGRAR